MPEFAEGPALQLDQVTKRFGAFTAVDELSFEVGKGEIFGFLGPNGAGKTTTLRIILDIIPQTSGAVSILGAPWREELRRRIGYLPEERGLYRKMRAFETIAYFATLRGMSGRAAKTRAFELLEEFGLQDFARARNESLSKGMAQKVQLLTAVAHDPEILILDEPFSGLDPINQSTLEELIRSLKNAGKTIVFSTHVMEHAERLCDRFLIVAQGRKRFEGSLGEARAAFPARLVVRTSAPASRLTALPGVAAAHAVGDAGAETEYRIAFKPGGDPQTFLGAAFEAGLKLSRFDTVDASLHDIFVALAGPGAAERASDAAADGDATINELKEAAA
ncbi:MAG: ABC transporter ATP-binding protein [Parvularculaceae bacterium]